MATFGVAGSHRRHQADVGSYHAVEHGQLGGDPLNTLAHGDLHATDIVAVRVACGIQDLNMNICQEKTFAQVNLIISGWWKI